MKLSRKINRSKKRKALKLRLIRMTKLSRFLRRMKLPVQMEAWIAIPTVVMSSISTQMRKDTKVNVSITVVTNIFTALTSLL